MNEERIKVLRERISGCLDFPTYHPTDSKCYFDMGTVWFRPSVPSSLTDAEKWKYRADHRCDSPACLIGHTLDLFGDPDELIEALKNFGGQADLAMRLLDLDVERADSLFYPAELDRLLAQDAIETLDNLLTTGKVVWPVKEDARCSSE